MKRLWILISVLVSGGCWYLSFDLSGNFWYLLWLAPIPVLFISFQLSARQTFLAAFVSYLIGRLNWVPYLLSVLPMMLVIVFTLLLPIIFAFIVVLARRVILKQNNWSVFAFPVLWCLFEFLMFKFSRDGTAGSIAYSEANFLPAIQIASVTGILGISFLVTLFPSVVALVIHKRYSKKIPVFVALIIMIASLSYGMIRVNRNEIAKGTITVGLGVVDEKFHSETNDPKPADELRVTETYADLIARLAKQGAQFIVLPEKMVNVKDGFGDSVKTIIANAARDNHATVIAGYTLFANDSTKHNNAWVISDDGEVRADYQKVNLFEGEAMNRFVPGNSIATFNLSDIACGEAICKDMDYDDFMRRYALVKTQVLFAPAWDFVRDGWLHSRMAVLRGVENGYAVIRTARQGRLTVSDWRGKVLYEASSENNKSASLIGKINVTARQTIYSRFGDWFGYVITITAIYFFVFSFKRSSRLQKT